MKCFQGTRIVLDQHSEILVEEASPESIRRNLVIIVFLLQCERITNIIIGASTIDVIAVVVVVSVSTFPILIEVHMSIIKHLLAGLVTFFLDH